MTTKLLGTFVAAAMAALTLPGAEMQPSASALRKLFAAPPSEYATAPLWVWNDLLSETQVKESMRDLAEQGVKQVFIHPRPGLMTPYLSSDWFRLWKVALQEGERLDMKVWIYDENSYPSGFAGGWVPELMPEAHGMNLRFSDGKPGLKWETNTLAVFRVEGGRVQNVSRTVQAGESLPSGGRLLVAALAYAPNAAWTGNRCYVNLLTPGVTEKFLEVTLEAYRRELGDEFGKRLPGSFTDEPHLRPAGGMPWCEDLPREFEKRRGYSLLDNLASLREEVGDWQKVRWGYFQTVLELFEERWGRPYYDYCAKYKLEFTGHYWEHEWPNYLGVPDNMAMAAWQQRPGIDILMNQYQENTHAQFGNVRSCREISSLANQLGRSRTLVELYGAGGWDLRFEDMKRIGDWLEVLGVNTLDQHLSYVTIRGARKRDHPQSFSYHEPWWPDYHISANYFARLTAALTQGEQINRVLVLEPTATAWIHQGRPEPLKALGDEFFKLLMSLESAQVEYDLGCEAVIARAGSVQGRELQVGNRRYAAVVLPPLTGNHHAKVASLFGEFLRAGGQVLSCAEPAGRVDGAVSTVCAGFSQAPGWRRLEPGAIAEQLHALPLTGGFAIQRIPGDQGILFHHRRQLADGEILFFVNTSIEHSSAGSFLSGLSGVEAWNAYTGKTEVYPFERTAQGLKADFTLPPSGSLLLFLSRKAITPPPVVVQATNLVAANGLLQARRLGPNVLTLDLVDVTAGGETRSNQYFYAAQQFVFKQNGLQRNPWDSAVQFKDEMFRRQCPAESGFEASYRFVIQGSVPANLAFVLERPDLYQVTCNGQPVQPKAGDWWLDKAFGKISIARFARAGENIVTIKASPFTIFHELEPAYVLGDFSLHPAGQGFVIAADRPLVLGPWNEQGHPFYSEGVLYQQQFNVDTRSGRYVVTLPQWLGSVCRVSVNGKPAGTIDAPPWECDITPALKRGNNTVAVAVIGTLKNTLGPHHGKPPRGTAWPRSFQAGPKTVPAGADYDTIGYGLFEPFALKNIAKK